MVVCMGTICILLVLFKWTAILSKFAQFRSQHCLKLFQVFYFCMCPFSLLLSLSSLINSVLLVHFLYAPLLLINSDCVINLSAPHAYFQLYQLHSNNHCFIQPFNFKFDDLSSTLLPFELFGFASNANIKL